MDNFVPQAEIPLEDGYVYSDSQILYGLAKDDFVRFVQEQYEIAKSGKQASVNKALAAYSAWRGELSMEEEAALAQIESATGYPAPRIFIKITKTKVQAAYSQIMEVLFAGNKFPLGLEPTPVPEGIPEYATIVPESSKEIVDIYGFAGDGQEITPGETWFTRVKSKLASAGKSLIPSASPDKTNLPQIHPAEEAARAAEKVVLDQLEETDASFALSRAVHEMCIIGTGVLKGPMNGFKIKHSWENMASEVVYSPSSKLSPKVNYVSFFNIFPDPSAKKVEECDFIIERHLLSPSQVRSLAKLPSFDTDALKRVLFVPPGEVSNEVWDVSVQDNVSQINNNRYEGLEFWGFLDESLATRLNLDFTEEDILLDKIMVNGWIIGGEVVKLVVNPFEPQRYPYYLCPYEEHPNQLWGISIAENMEDVQGIMNAHIRMATENLRLAGNLILEVNENQLKPGQSLTLFPGKVFRKQGGAPGQSIYPISFNDVSQSHLFMFDKARQLSDEATGIPSFSHGSTGVMGTGRTASGMSMLMSAAALNIKTVIKNIDRYFLKPLGEQLYYWNMQFNNSDFKIKGDVRIVAMGTTSLMQREVLTQRLITLLQTAGSSPLTAPFINAPEILKQICLNMGLDPDKVVNSQDKALIYAELLQKTQGLANGNSGNLSEGGGPETASAGGQLQSQGGTGSPISPSGGGRQASSGSGGIGIGNIPQAGEPNFTGSSQTIQR